MDIGTPKLPTNAELWKRLELPDPPSDLTDAITQARTAHQSADELRAEVALAEWQLATYPPILEVLKGERSVLKERSEAAAVDYAVVIRQVEMMASVITGASATIESAPRRLIIIESR